MKYNRLASQSKQRYLGIIFLGEKQLHVGLTPGSIAGYTPHTVYYTDHPHSILILQWKLNIPQHITDDVLCHYMCVLPQVEKCIFKIEPQTTSWKIYWQHNSIEVDTNGCLRAHKLSLLLISYIFAQYY